MPEPEDRPFLAVARLAPKDLGRAFLVDLQAGRIAVADIGTAKFRIAGIDPDSADGHAADDRPADPAVGERFEQDHEPPSERRRRSLANEQHPVLELLQVLARLHDRPRDAEHVEAAPVAAGVVADLDDAGLAELGIVGPVRFEQFATGVAGRIEEGVVGRRRDLQLLAGHHGLEGVAGHATPRFREGRNCRSRTPARRKPLLVV